MAGDSSSTHARFQRHRPRLPSSASGGKTDSSPENSLSSYSAADHEFSSPVTSVTISVEALTMMQKEISTLKEKVNTLEERVDELKAEVASSQRLRAEVAELKKQIKGPELRVSAHKDIVDEPKGCTGQLITIPEHSKSLSMVHHTGTVSITDNANPHKRITYDETVTTTIVIPCEPQTSTKSTNSTPFFSDKDNSGYQMCINLSRSEDLNPELTFALVIMRSKLDKNLPWPFNRKIILTVIGNNTNKDKIIMIQPNSEKSFQRPKSDLSEPFTVLKIHYTVLFDDGFISDDKVTFQVTVT